MAEPISVVGAARARAHEGMEIAAVAALDPDRLAITSDRGDRTFAQLNARANQLAHLLRERGYKTGDGIALLCSNRPEFIEVVFAAHRLGARLTTVNWHLAPEEAGYIIDDCDAVALFADDRSAEAAQFAVNGSGKLLASFAIGDPIDGLEDYESAIAGQPETDIENPARGNLMQYTSGTTGRPKGVMREQPDPAAAAGMQELLTLVFQFDPDSGTDRALVAGPLYHSGPYNLGMNTPLTAGIGIVMMDKWTPQDCLRLIEQHRITHSFMVPTMFMRMLELPDEQRKAFDVSSLKKNTG